MKFTPMTHFQSWLYNYDVLAYDYYMNEAPKLPCSEGMKEAQIMKNRHELHSFGWAESLQGPQYWAGILVKYLDSINFDWPECIN